MSARPRHGIADDAAAVVRAFLASSTEPAGVDARLAIDRQAAELIADGMDLDEVTELAEIYRRTGDDPEGFALWVSRRRPRAWWMQE